MLGSLLLPLFTGKRIFASQAIRRDFLVVVDFIKAPLPVKPFSIVQQPSFIDEGINAALQASRA